MRIALVFTSLLALAASAHAKPETDAIKRDWLALMAGGCDLAAHGVHTPFAASVLRNTPYALAGYAFKSEGLRALFSSDGGWYTPKSKTTPTFDARTGACIKKIKAFEAANKLTGMKAFKERLFKDRATYLDIRSHSRAMKAKAIFSAAGMSAEVKCPKCDDLQYYQIMCDVRECLVLVPGTGDLP